MTDTSEAYILSDEGKTTLVVIAGCGFALGDVVLIRYGKFSNATLILDFGFAVSCNCYDQVHVELNVPQHDALYTQKLDILGRDRTPRIKDDNEFAYYDKWDMRISQSLRAFARMISKN
ncbi:hypothetical protein SASPL_149090 [Salvia splendens]|uniref:Uncharacterized protein n=1 Tax=Salvia splendens TaxID=180675 RepID=A0A8X8WC58_SALSN|nr:hypothetical protein SASPL_149090 [Salvia splendens]